MAPPGRTAGWLEDAPAHGASVRALATPASTASVLLLACVAAAVSVGLQGFYFAVINNSYHIPIVDGWIDDPQFASDQYIQSLRYHTSYVWPLAHQMARWLSTHDTFLLLHVANRVAMFFGLGLLVRALGVRTLAGVSACVLSIAVTRYLLAASGPGEHDLFMPFLNHSSLTWPFLFASWLFLLRGRIALSLAMQGPVFAVNAFVAICGGPAVAAGCLAALPSGRATRRAGLLQLLAGLALALAIAAPTIRWILDSFTEQPAAAPFSFLGFLHSYYMKHWYVTAASPRRLVSFCIVALGGLACLRLLGPPARCLVPVWWGYLAVFAAGAALPYVADSRVLLVLHPMRVGAGCLVMLCVVAIVAYLGRTLEAMPSPAAALAAALGLLGFAAGQGGLVVMAIAVGFVAVSAARAPARPSPLVFAVLAAGLLGIGGWRALREAAPYDVSLLDAARDAGLWIEAHTPPGSMVFVPSGAVDGEDDPVSVWARRPVWYDWKQGAAVMWTPSYHEEWSARRADAATLKSVADVMAYACAKRIDIVVEDARRLADPGVRERLKPALAYENEAYAVLRAAPACGGRF